MDKLSLSTFTVDVEDGISIAMRDRFGKNIPQTDRVVRLTHELLELLDTQGAKGTFFTLGQVGEDLPELVREIHAAGHEVGVHGYDHHVFHDLNRETAWQELTRAKALLEDLTGERVIGHRAPKFSVDARTAWALDLLVEAGFEYDSSIMPGRGIGYGWAGQRRTIGPVETPSGKSILEAPPTVVDLLGKTAPALGGSYFRLLPFPVSQRIFERVAQEKPVIIYLHPYEIDRERYPDFYFDEMKQTPLKTQLRMRSFWLRRKSVKRRYEKLLSKFRFAPLRDLIAAAKADAAETAPLASSAH